MSNRIRIAWLTILAVVSLVLAVAHGFSAADHLHAKAAVVATMRRPTKSLPRGSVSTAAFRRDQQEQQQQQQDDAEELSLARRNAIIWSTSVGAGAALLSCTPPSSLAGATETSATATATSSALKPAVVTDRVFFDVRISRQDGTFYVRDDLPDTIENQVFTGRLTLGLFGQAAPNHVQRFLSYVNTGNKPLDDNPLPSYSRSVFSQFDAATGVLFGGAIPSLEVTELQGSAALRYGGRLLPAKLWITAQETATSNAQLRHTAPGLLTHQNLDVTPRFGITTRSDTNQLDRTHTVFGQLLRNDPTNTAFLERVQTLPVYSVDRPPAPIDRDETVVEDAAAAVFAFQRDLFRSAAKNFGDTRIDKLVAGKLLRRVEVTQVGML